MEGEISPATAGHMRITREEPSQVPERSICMIQLRAVGVATALTLTLLGTACSAPITEAVAAGELEDLGSVEDLAAEFNRDAGEPRLILLLSPT